ncbi:NapC/NirT family cytochrome c [[Pasteurella] aerogenes]
MAKKGYFLTALGIAAVGALAVLGTQYVMKETSNTEFCVSCHSMSYPQEEWAGSVHFSNRKGIRAECADCHVPHEGLDYVKAKVVALKDVWYEWQGKLKTQEDFEKHRAEMAKTVWQQMKDTDSATCKTCHTMEAMVLSEQSESAQKMHKLAQETNQTCIDCHKGLVHFLPENDVDNAAATTELAKHGGEFAEADNILYALAMTPAQLVAGGDIRLMPFAELTAWKAEGEEIVAQLHGWQQVGAESVVYSQLGQRIMLALVEDNAKAQVKIEKTVHDDVTASDWNEVSLAVKVNKKALTSNLAALDQFGHNLNETHCSGCHAAIGAGHYTANQWIGVVNSMKDRTSMSADDVRAVTIYLQRNAKDMQGAAH